MILENYKYWLDHNYSNPTTRKEYYGRISYLLRIFEEKYKEPPELNQKLVDFIIINTNNLENSFYFSAARSFGDFINETHQTLHLVFKKDRSKRRTKTYDVYDFFTTEDVDKLIKEGNIYISLVAELIKNTGLRRTEIINLKREGINFDNLTITGIGKNNTEYLLPISKKFAERLEVWLSEAQNPNQPFIKYKKVEYNKEKKQWLFYPFKDPANKIHRDFLEECIRLNIKTASGDPPHLHCCRHRFAKTLREKGLDIVQIKAAMRHKNIETTKIYVDITPEETERAIRKTFEE